MNLQASSFVCVFFYVNHLNLFLLRFGLPWFAKRIIVASNDINEDTPSSLNQQVYCTSCVVPCKSVVFMNYWWFENNVPWKPHPQFAGGIWKRIFIPTVRPTIHTNLSRKRSFLKSSSNWADWKTPELRLSVDEKHWFLQMELFENDDNTIIMCTGFPAWVFHKHKSKISDDCSSFLRYFSHFPGVVWTENFSCVFRVKMPC